MMARQEVCLLIVALVLAGCTTAPKSGAHSDTAGQSVEGSAKPVTAAVHFHITGTKTTFYKNPAGEDVKIPPNTSAVLMEVRGGCTANGPCDLRMILFDPDGKGEASGVATNAHGKMRLDAPKTGQWAAQVWPESPAVDAEGDMFVTLFPGPLPANFSAIPG